MIIIAIAKEFEATN